MNTRCVGYLYIVMNFLSVGSRLIPNTETFNIVGIRTVHRTIVGRQTMNDNRVRPIAIVTDGDVVFLYFNRGISLPVTYVDKIPDIFCAWPCLVHIA